MKVIDFGVAKATQQRLTEQTLFTEQGQLIGTPGYMSPEQAEMTALDIDTRTDVYSLGVLLYELLVGALPFDDQELRQAGLAEMQRIIREVEPAKPSTRLSSLQAEPRPSGSGGRSTALGHGQSEPRARATGLSIPCSRSGLGSAADIAHRRRTDPRTLIRKLRGDLDWIVMKCLEKDRTRRYDTANGLALEIQRFLNTEPVLAGPPSAGYRLRKFLRRNKGPVVAIAAIVLALAAGVVATGLMYRQALHERDRAIEAEQLTQQSLEAASAARDDAEAVTKFLTDTLAAVDPEQKGKDVMVREVLNGAASRIRKEFADRPVIQARLHYTVGATYRSLGVLDEAQAHLADAAGLYNRHEGAGHSMTLAAANALSAVLFECGNYSAAQAQLTATLEIQKRVLGEENLHTLTSMNNLAALYAKQGRNGEAEPLYLKTLEIRKRVLGEEHLHTLNSMGNLAALYDHQGRYAEAEALCHQTVEIKKRVLGEEHPSTLMSMGNLAALYEQQGRYAEAEPLCRQTLEIKKRVLGEQNPHTLGSMNNLAELYRKQGRYHEAEAIAAKAVAGTRKVLSPEHPHLAGYRGTYGQILLKLGRFEEAEQLFLDSYAVMSTVGGMRKEAAETAQALVELYEARHAAEPGKGYDAKAAHWRAKLPEEGTQEEQPLSQAGDKGGH